MAKRVAIGFLAVVISLGGLIVVIAAAEISDTPTCHAVNRGEAEPKDNSCFDGSTARRSVQVVLAGASGLVALLAIVPGLAFAIREKWLQIFLIMLAASVALFFLYFLAGQIG